MLKLNLRKKKNESIKKYIFYKKIRVGHVVDHRVGHGPGHGCMPTF